MHYYYAACKSGNAGVVKSALQKILKNRSSEAYLSFLNKGLFIAAMFGRQSIVSLLIDKGADVNYQKCGKNGQLDHSVLMAAIIGNHCGVVNLLLEKNCNVELKTASGLNALMIVARNGYTQMVEMLITHGAYVDQVNLCGFTPLMIALKLGHIETARKLVEHGADLKKKNNSGSNALLLSAFNNKLKSVRFVLAQHDYGDINMYLGFNTKLGIIRKGDHYLLGEEDVRMYLNALDLAKIHKNSAMISLLEKHGAKSAENAAKCLVMSKQLGSDSIALVTEGISYHFPVLQNEEVSSFVDSIDIESGVVHFSQKSLYAEQCCE